MKSQFKGLANNFNGGYLDQDSEWIYYCNPLDEKAGIYKIKKDMSEKIKLLDKKVSNINVYKSWIYFSEQSTIYKMRKNGSEIRKLISINAENSIYEMCIYDDWIYYTDDLPYGSLYKMTIDGTNNTKISVDSPMYINIFDNHIYYAGEKSDGECGIYRIDLNGNNKMKILDEDIESLNVYDQWLYFTNSVNRLGLYRISTDGQIKNSILDKKVSNLNILNDWIYYINISDSNSLYRMKIDGTENNKLDEHLCSSILVFDDYVYYNDISEEQICRLDISSLSKKFLNAILIE
ncbi:TPA: DUF5050 domain-containing protein [Bacillus anthracis]|nr:DUF5050 domain-containing protein [Bacillus anthracis]